MGGYAHKPGGTTLLQQPIGGGATDLSPGKRTLAEQLGQVVPHDVLHPGKSGGTAAATAMPAATSGELPYRRDMERSFGRSFGDVSAHIGMAAELAPLGAQALTVGHTVAFAEDQPSPALVAHETAHVVQNEQAVMAVPMAAGVVGTRESAAETEAEATAHRVAIHGPGVRLPPIAAAPAAHVQLAPKLLRPDPHTSPHSSPLPIPDVNHPARSDRDGEQVVQTGEMHTPGEPAPSRNKSWKALAEIAESVQVRDDSGDALRIDTTYRLESRPAELRDTPDIWIHTQRKALLTIVTGEHAGATIVGQARVHLAPGEARDPKAAISKASVGASHWAQIYLAEAQQFVNVHGPGGRASLRADASDHDVLAYDEPLRTLVGLKSILKQQRVAGHGADVARLHAKAQRLLVDAERGRGVLEREIAAIASHHDPHPGRVVPVKFLIGDIGEWLTANKRAGRDETEDAHHLRKARAELEQLIADAEHAHAPKRDPLDDALNAPVRFAERTAHGATEVGAMAIDAIVLGVDAIGQATGVGSFEYHPMSRYGQSIDATGASTTIALVTMVNGFADEWHDAIERAAHGDYRGLTDVSIDTLMLIDGARTTGVIGVDKVEAIATRLGRIARSAHALAKGLHGELRDIATAMADGADAFTARLHPAAGMQMAGAGAGGGSGPSIGGGLNADTFAEAAKAAKQAFKDKRHAQQAHQHAEHGHRHANGPRQPASGGAGDSETRSAYKLDKLRALDLEPGTLARFADLDAPALEKFGALRADELQKFAQLRNAEMIAKFAVCDLDGLRKLATLERSFLEKFAGWDAQTIKNISDLEMPSIELISQLKVAPGQAVEGALSSFQTEQFRVGSEVFQLDKRGMAHILERHHPLYWDGSVKVPQSFMNPRIGVADIVSAIRDVMQQNRERLIERGTNVQFQITGIHDGTTYILGISKGRIGQFYAP